MTSSIFLLMWGCTSKFFAIEAGNTPPSVTIVSHEDSDNVAEGSIVTFRAVLSDADDAVETLTSVWYSDGEPYCSSSPPNERGESICDIPIEASLQEIRIEARDPDNSMGTDVVSPSVVLNTPPDITLLNPTDTENYSVSEAVLFEALTADEEDPPASVSVYWSSDLDGSLALPSVPSTQGVVSGTVFLSEGEHVITATAVDSGNKENNATVVVQVSPSNLPPVLDLIDIQNTNADSIEDALDGMFLYCHSQFTDPEGEELSYTYVWTDQEGTILSSSDSDRLLLNYAAQNLQATDVLTCTVTASDGQSQTSASDSVALLSCDPFAIEIPYDGLDSNCDGLEWLNDQNRDGSPDDAMEDYDDNNAFQGALGLECYGEAHVNADGTRTYYVICDNNHHWKQALNICLDNGYDALATANDSSEFQAFVDIAATHLVFVPPDGRVRQQPWLGFTRGPDCSPVSSTGLPYSSTCGGDIRSYYWLDGSDSSYIEDDLSSYWHSAEMTYISEPTDYTTHNTVEHCAFLKVDTTEVGFFDLYCDYVPSGSHSAWSANHTRASACVKR